MQIQFIFPCSLLDNKLCDEEYASEYNTLTNNNYNTLLWDQSNNRVIGDTCSFSHVIYRGWMLSYDDYQKFDELLLSKGLCLLSDFDDYIHCHYFPFWYENIKHLNITAKSYYSTDIQNPELPNDGTFLIKDFVKSNSSSEGSFASDSDKLERIIEQLIAHRGYIEGGLVYREYERYNQKSEFRIFVFNNKPYTSNDNIVIPEFVYEIIKLTQSMFFSIDIVRNIDNEYRLVEIGDAQVSGLKEWKVSQFCNIFKD